MGSLGVILFIMCAARPPFEEAKKDDYWYQLLAKKQYQRFWQSNDDLHFSRELQDLLHQMLADTERDRISIEDILRHPWLSGRQHGHKKRFQHMNNLYLRAKTAKAKDT